MLRNSSPPIEPRRFDAPTTATERGWKNGSSEARTATWSRSATCSRYASVGAIANRISSSPAFAGARDREARVAEDVEHRGVVVQHLRDELLDPGLRGPGRELLEQARPDSAPLELVADGEGDLRGARVAQPDPVRDGHDAAVERPEQRAPLLPVGREQRLDELRPERGKAVEAEVAAVLGQAGEELEQRVGILRDGRSQPQRRPVAEDDVGRLDRGRGRGAHAAADVLDGLHARPDDEHRTRRRVYEPGRDAAGEEPLRGAPAVGPDHDQLRVVLARDLADLLDREPVGEDGRAGQSGAARGRGDRGQELSHALVLGLRELGDDVRVAVGGIADRGQRRMRDGDDDERSVEPVRELERFLLCLLGRRRAVGREQDRSGGGHLTASFS